jgi:pre-mRNA-processing factor SLU7
VHISYCTGEAGKEAAKASSAQNLLEGSGSQPEDSTSKSPLEGGDGDKGKQRKTDVDVEAEQSKLSEERKRKGRTNEGDERFNKKSKNEEATESKKFDVSEDELGMDFVQDCVGMVNANECIQRDTVVRRVEWMTRCRTMLTAGTCSI